MLSFNQLKQAVEERQAVIAKERQEQIRKFKEATIAEGIDVLKKKIEHSVKIMSQEGKLKSNAKFSYAIDNNGLLDERDLREVALEILNEVDFWLSTNDFYDTKGELNEQDELVLTVNFTTPPPVSNEQMQEVAKQVGKQISQGDFSFLLSFNK